MRFISARLLWYQPIALTLMNRIAGNRFKFVVIPPQQRSAHRLCVAAPPSSFSPARPKVRPRWQRTDIRFDDQCSCRCAARANTFARSRIRAAIHDTFQLPAQTGDFHFRWRVYRRPPAKSAERFYLDSTTPVAPGRRTTDAVRTQSACW